MKQIEEDPWLALPAKYPTGTELDGVVRNLTSFGAFVEIEPGIDGLVHVSDLSWTRRVEHPSEVIQKGDEVRVLVLDVDAEAKRSPAECRPDGGITVASWRPAPLRKAGAVLKGGPFLDAPCIRSPY